MSKRTTVERFDPQTEEHLTRYLANREKRTGQKWEVVERYNMLAVSGTDWRSGGYDSYSWDRALIKAEDGSTLRIYHYGSGWRMGQKVLAPKAPYGRCLECGKPCPFDHDVPAEELVCDVCAGAPEDEVDW